MSDDRPEDSVTPLLARIRAGDQGSVVAHLWLRYFERLLPLVRAQLRGTREGERDEEDIAQSVLRRAFDRLREGRYEAITEGESLWKMLVVMAKRKSSDERKRRRARKRDQLRESDTAIGDDLAWSDRFIDHNPTPEEAATIADEVRALLAQLSADLRGVAELLLAGFATRDIADEYEVSVRTVQRWVWDIKDAWLGEDVEGTDDAD